VSIRSSFFLKINVAPWSKTKDEQADDNTEEEDGTDLRLDLVGIDPSGTAGQRQHRFVLHKNDFVC